MIVADLPGQSPGFPGPIRPPQPGYEFDTWGKTSNTFGNHWDKEKRNTSEKFQLFFSSLLAHTILNDDPVWIGQGLSTTATTGAGYFTMYERRRLNATHVLIDLNKYQIQQVTKETLAFFEPISQTDYLNPNSDYNNRILVLKAPRDKLRKFLKENEVA